MSEIDLTVIRRTAELARIKFTDDELEPFRRQFQRILDYVETLNELDLDAVEPTSHVLSQENVFREDEIKPSLPREVLLSAAPESRDGMVVVPPVLDES